MKSQYSEIWKPVQDPKFRHLYEVSTLGNVRDSHTKELANVVLNKSGISMVEMFAAKRRTYKSLLRLVWLAHGTNIPGGCSPKPRDGDYLNGALSNVELCSRKCRISDEHVKAIRKLAFSPLTLQEVRDKMSAGYKKLAPITVSREMIRNIRDGKWRSSVR